MSADNSLEILEKAAATYRSGSLSYRDTLLKTGRLLHEFILAHLKAGDAIPEKRRVREGFTRKRAVEMAAKKLSISSERVHHLIRPAMAVLLLAGEEGIGGTPWGVIYRMSLILQRRHGFRGNPAGRHKPISTSEEWEIRPGAEEAARALFQRAVSEKFTQSQANAEIAVLMRQGKPRIRREQASSASTPISAIYAAVAGASPGDIADLCISLIEKAADPLCVIEHLKERLVETLAKIKRMRLGLTG